MPVCVRALVAAVLIGQRQQCSTMGRAGSGCLFKRQDRERRTMTKTVRARGFECSRKSRGQHVDTFAPHRQTSVIGKGLTVSVKVACQAETTWTLALQEELLLLLKPSVSVCVYECICECMPPQGETSVHGSLATSILLLCTCWWRGHIWRCPPHLPPVPPHNPSRCISR